MAKKRPASADSGFMADIVAHPEDDTPRLVYADWLEENGQPQRAEFIRVQIEQARLGPGDPNWLDLDERARGLLKTHGAAWGQEVPAGATHWYRRGFVAQVLTPVAQFLVEGAGWRRALPLEGVYLKDAAGQVAELANSPLLAGLRGLSFYSSDAKLGPDDAVALARSPHLESVRVLGLSSNRVGNPGVRALAGAPHLQSLEHLFLAHSFSAFGDAPREPLDLGPLVDSAHRERLKTLDLGCDWLSAESWGRLGEFPSLAALMVPAATPREMKRFAQSLRRPSLRLLCVCIGPGRVEGVRALANSPALSGLNALELTHCDFTDKTVEALATSPHLGNLRDLNLAANHIGNAGALALANSPGLTGLVFLNLGRNKIFEEGAKSLAASPHLRSLRRLDVRGNGLGLAGKDALRERFGAGVWCDRGDEERAPGGQRDLLPEPHFRWWSAQNGS